MSVNQGANANFDSYLTAMFLNSLLHPFLQTEQMGIESIFAITITTFSPGDNTYLIPPFFCWMLVGRKEVPQYQRGRISKLQIVYVGHLKKHEQYQWKDCVKEVAHEHF